MMASIDGTLSDGSSEKYNCIPYEVIVEVKSIWEQWATKKFIKNNMKSKVSKYEHL